MDKEIVHEGGGRSADFDWSCARAWIGGAGIKEIIFLRAHLLTSACIHAIAEFAIATDISLTLVSVPQETTRPHRDALRCWPFAEVTLDSMMAETP